MEKGCVEHAYITPSGTEFLGIPWDIGIPPIFTPYNFFSFFLNNPFCSHFFLGPALPPYCCSMYAESSQIYLPFTTPDICVPIPTSLPRTHITYLRSPRYCALYPALYPGLYRLSADRYLDRWGLEHHVIAFVCRVDMIPLQIELKVFASISSFLGYDVSNV